MPRGTAAVFEKLFTPLAVSPVFVADPGPGEALIRVVASGVCHTDALARDGDMPFPAPGVLGHESAGVVEAVGPGVCGLPPRRRDQTSAPHARMTRIRHSPPRWARSSSPGRTVRRQP